MAGGSPRVVQSDACVVDQTLLALQIQQHIWVRRTASPDATAALLVRAMVVRRCIVRGCCWLLQMRYAKTFALADVRARKSGKAAGSLVSVNLIAVRKLAADSFGVCYACVGVALGDARWYGVRRAGDVWRNMLQALRGVSELKVLRDASARADRFNVCVYVCVCVGGFQAAAVVAAYATPLLLLRAYKTCANDEQRAALLQDLTVARPGRAGPPRRLGPAVSATIFRFVWASDPTLELYTTGARSASRR